MLSRTDDEIVARIAALELERTGDLFADVFGIALA